MKKTLSVLIVTLMILTLAFPVFAGTPTEGVYKNFTWSFSGGTLSISGTGPLPVNAPWADHRKSVRTLCLSGKGMTLDEAYQFSNYSAVTTVRLGQGVTATGDNVFSSLGERKRIKLIIEDKGFVFNPKSFTAGYGGSITLPDGSPYRTKDGFLFGDKNREVVMYYGKDNGFAVVPDTVRTIRAGAFKRSALQYILLPPGLEVIEDEAFARCENLRTINIPESVKKIGCSVFSGCGRLTDIGFVNAVPERTESSGSADYYYDMDTIKELVLPGISDLSAVAVNNCRELTSVIVSEGCTTCAGYTGSLGSNCRKLKEIWLPESLTEIGVSKIPDRKDIMLFVIEGSAAHAYAEKYRMQYTLVRPAQKVTVSEETLTLTAGKTANLKATIEPEDATAQHVQWISTDSGVATVDSKGHISTHSAGECDIIARAADCTGVSAVCHLTSIRLISKLIPEEKNMVIPIGTARKVSITAEPGDATQKTAWLKCAKEGIVSLEENNIIRGIGLGTCRIDVTADDGGPARASFNVTVVEPMTSVTLSDTEITVDKGKSAALTAEGSPETAGYKKFVWSSSNEKIAKVQNGRVTGVSVGKCEIVCTAADGSGVKAKCTVTVVHRVQNVRAETGSKKLKTGETYIPKIIVTPNDATSKVLTWSSSDESVCTVDPYGTVRAVGAGECVITFTTVDGSEKSGTIRITVE